MAVLVGKAAPDFTAVAVMGNNDINENFTLSKHIKNKAAVVFFYPLDFTFVCPTELEDLATDCMAVWESPQSEKSSQILHRILNLQHYLAVTGNWSDFLELVGVAPQDWDQSEEGCR